MAWRRYSYLVQRGLVNNRASLRNRIKNHNFPSGTLIGPNTRAWTDEELDEYEANCPTDPKAVPRRRRARKSVKLLENTPDR
jgi:hypothetical protein